MGSRGAAATLHLMVVATLTLAAATFMSTAEAGYSKSVAQQKSKNTSGRFRVPEGGQDGIDKGSVEVDEQGVEQYRVKYLGEGNATLGAYGRWATNNVNVSRPGGLGRKLLQQDSGAHCQAYALDSYDILLAINKVANYFGPNGADMPAHATWVGKVGGTLAYICNFNDVPHFTTSDRILKDNLYISAACTASSAGYFSRETTNSVMGRTYVGNNNFCEH